MAFTRKEPRRTYIVIHRGDGGWTNYHGPFHSVERAREFIVATKPSLPEDHSLSWERVFPPAEIQVR